MTKPRFTPAYPAELRERGVRLVRDRRGEYASDNAASRAIAPKLGGSPDSLRVWCRQAERDAGQRDGLTRAEKSRLKELEREVRELRTANEILKKASALTLSLGPVAFLRSTSLRRSSTARSASDCVHRQSPQRLWCRADLPGSGDRIIVVYTFKALERDPDLASDRTRQDRLDMAAIRQAFDDSRGRYGARKVWHRLRREGRDIARLARWSG